MRAAIRLAQVQLQSDSDFLSVDLVVSSSWNLPAARVMVRDTSAKQVLFNSCFGTGPRYRALTISGVLRDRLRCSIGRRMTMLSHDDVRKVIGEVNDIRENVRAEQHLASAVMNMVDNLHDAEKTECVHIDDVSEEELSKEKVAEARKCELRTFRDMKVYTYVRREEAQSRGKIIGVRWVDSLKGDVVKSRLVAQEFASRRDRDEYFCSHTHPQMASKSVLSDTASRETVGATSRRPCVLDVKRAFLYGVIEEHIHAELPDKDIWKKQEFVEKLIKATYGTRSAPLHVTEGGEG